MGCRFDIMFDTFFFSLLLQICVRGFPTYFDTSYAANVNILLLSTTHAFFQFSKLMWIMKSLFTAEKKIAALVLFH